mgnify:CR=1 FL=1
MIYPKNISSIKHVAIIMDGNGRWANDRSHRRIWGHVRGSRIVSDMVREAGDLGLDALTLYSFSTENWSRPFLEVKSLINLLKKWLHKRRPMLTEHQIRFRVMGDIGDLPDSTKELIRDIEETTKNFKGLKLTIAFGYGGRSELVGSVNKWINKNPGKKISERDISANMLITDFDDVDLLIRTGGDKRISNFMLWQIAYSELWFTNTRWPDFSRREFSEIVNYVRQRDRRFGSVDSKLTLEDTSKIAEINRKSFQEGSRVKNV